MSSDEIVATRRDIATQLLKIGATAYGGPAIMGIMQTELQEKRQWVSKERFMEGLSLVNMLPGATAAQLSIFLGYARGGGSPARATRQRRASWASARSFCRWARSRSAAASR